MKNLMCDGERKRDKFSVSFLFAQKVMKIHLIFRQFEDLNQYEDTILHRCAIWCCRMSDFSRRIENYFQDKNK